jgi:hypothetical protein
VAGGMEWLGGNAFYGLRAGSSMQDTAGSRQKDTAGRQNAAGRTQQGAREGRDRGRVPLFKRTVKYRIFKKSSAQFWCFSSDLRFYRTRSFSGFTVSLRAYSVRTYNINDRPRGFSNNFFLFSDSVF